MAKLYILRWNPAISSFTTPVFLDGVQLLGRKDSSPLGLDWSIYDHGELEVGDWWILCRVGTDEDGIVALGQFTGEPEEGDSWRRDGKKVHYAMMAIKAMQCPEKTGILQASELEKKFSEIGWHSGHSGVPLAPDVAERLMLFVAEELYRHSDAPGLGVRQIDGGIYSVVCGILTHLCPNLRATLDKEPQEAANFDEVPEYPDDIAFDADALKNGSNLADAARPIFWGEVIPVKIGIAMCGGRGRGR
ncbi:MAG: hypothetical protein MJ025_07240 [Victivallaceae bacterium]|nr:hypothetical protein [Victivallaceae bacterium]